MSVLKRKNAGVWEVVGGGEAPPIQLGYAQVTANQSGITTEVDLTGLTVTVNVAAGRRIRITACVSVAGGSGHGYGVAIKEGATQLQVGTITTPTPGSQDTLTTSWVGTPSAGPHTYKLTMRRFLGATTPGVMFADATTPAFILVEDITGGSGAPSGSSVAFADYTPSNTNITVGNGTQVARYARIGTGAGSLIVVRYCLTWGSTTSFGGAIQIGLPVAAAATGIQGVVQGNAYSLDSGTAENLALATRLTLGSTTSLGVFGTTGVSVSNTQPHTWAINDVLAVSVMYEAGA